MIGSLIIFIFFVIFLILINHFFYKKFHRFDQKVEKSINQLSIFSDILSDIHNLSMYSEADFKKNINLLLLEFTNNLLDPKLVVFYEYVDETKTFDVFDYRYSHKKIDFALDLHFKNDAVGLSKYFSSHEIEILSKKDKRNKDKYPLISYFNSSLIIVPFEVDNNPIGVLFIYCKENKSYLNILKIVMSYFANSLKSMNLYKSIKTMSIETIKALVEAIDAKSQYTRQHTERVTFYTKKILDKIDYSRYDIKNIEKFKNDVECASMLHDVGKIGVSEEILNKPGALSKEEFAIMNKHPEIGVNILSHLHFLREITPLVLYHHEKYDGTGYSLTLKGEDIPLGARILAVADAYDAMTSDRSYRKALSQEVAVAEILKHSGKHFDPYIASIFINYLNE